MEVCYIVHTHYRVNMITTNFLKHCVLLAECSALILTGVTVIRAGLRLREAKII
jgi:hypothetical protein